MTIATYQGAERARNTSIDPTENNGLNQPSDRRTQPRLMAVQPMTRNTTGPFSRVAALSAMAKPSRSDGDIPPSRIQARPRNSIAARIAASSMASVLASRASTAINGIAANSNAAANPVARPNKSDPMRQTSNNARITPISDGSL